MKRIISIFCVVLMVLSLASCNTKKTGEKLTVAALKGPTAIGLVQLMDEAAGGKSANDYEFTLAGAPDEITGGIINGDYDIACVPTNLAATLYNKTNGDIQIIALVTKGVLYVVTTRDDIHTVSDLAGKTVWSSGKGSTAEYAFNYVLDKSGILNDVTVEYVTEHAEIASKFQLGEADIAVLPQPFVTSALNQLSGLRVALDLTAEWDAAAEDGSMLVMSAVIAQKSVIESKTDAIKALMNEYKTSIEFVTDPNNIDAVAKSVVNYGIIATEQIAKAAIPECNITWLAGDEMKNASNGFLTALYEQNPQSVGGSLPDSGIYYFAK